MEHQVLDCENCSYYDRGNEVCMHPDAHYSDECIWRNEE